MRAKLYIAWSVLKCVVAVPLAPLLIALFFVSKRAFIAALSFLWVHLDIYTPEGELYLRRWFFSPKFRQWWLPHPRFLHLIRLSDKGRDPHDHPGGFTTTILWNGYDEEIYFPREPKRISGLGRPGAPLMRHVRAFGTYVNPPLHTHRVTLIGPTLSWVVGWKRGKKWGFWVMDQGDPSKDRWVESEEYGEKGEERKSWTIDGK